MTLWLASFVPGLALSYLGSNLKCGDALIGVADPQLIVGGEDAPMFEGPFKTAMAESVEVRQELGAISDADAEEVSRSEDAHERYINATDGLRRVFDMWTADPLGLTGARRELSLYGNLVVDGVYGEHDTAERIATESIKYADRYRFLHWPLEFPHVFSGDNPGFNVVVGNPPWKKVKVEDLTYFGRHAPGLRGIVDSREKRRQLQALKDANPNLVTEFNELREKLSNAKLYFREHSGGYVLQHRADTDTFRLFCERYMSIWSQGAYMGVVVPIGVLIGDGSERLRKALLTTHSIVRVNTLINRRKWAFPEVHGQYLIALLAAKCQAPTRPLKINSSWGHSESEIDFNVSNRANDIDISGSHLPNGYQLPRFRSGNGVVIYGKMWRKSHVFEAI